MSRVSRVSKGSKVGNVSRVSNVSKGLRSCRGGYRVEGVCTFHGLSASKYGFVSAFTFDTVPASVKFVMMQAPSRAIVWIMSSTLERSTRLIDGLPMLPIFAELAGSQMQEELVLFLR